MAAASRESGTWLTALPFAAFGNHLDESSFKIAIALRLGVEVCAKHTCVCEAAADKYGTHGLSCEKSKESHARHPALNELIHRSLASAKVSSELATRNGQGGRKAAGWSHYVSMEEWLNSRVGCLRS